MSETSHVLEEMRSLRGAHADLLAEMGQLCVQVRELVIELRHTQRNIDNFSDRMGKIEGDIRALQLDNALNKPILDIARSMNTKMWVTLLGAAMAVGSMNVNWTNVMGG